MTAQGRRTMALDLAWNYVSVGVLAISGLLFSLIITTGYTASVLGVFNQVYAYYLLLSQLAVCGVHMSVAKFVPQHHKQADQCKTIFTTALISCTATSLLIEAVGFSVVAVMDIWIISNVLDGIKTTLFALPFFSCNKVILGYINGLSRMKAYAVLQALRNILIALSLLAFMLTGTPGEMLTLCFLVSEGVLFVVSILYLACSHLLGYSRPAAAGWVSRHLKFGIKSLLGNMILEFNTKIDVLCLGLITGNNTLVGHYSFASQFIEGFYMLYVVIRRNLNPKLAQAHADNRIKVFVAGIKDKLTKWLYGTAVPLVMLLVGGYYLLCHVIGKPEYLIATIPLAIVTSAIALTSRSIVMGNLLTQSNHPLQESIVNVLTAVSNFLLNLLFIWLWGMVGAAIANAVSYMIYALTLQYFTQKRLDIKI